MKIINEEALAQSLWLNLTNISEGDAREVAKAVMHFVDSLEPEPIDEHFETIIRQLISQEKCLNAIHRAVTKNTKSSSDVTNPATPPADRTIS